MGGVVGGVSVANNGIIDKCKYIYITVVRPYLSEKLLLGPDQPNFAQILFQKKIN